MPAANPAQLVPLFNAEYTVTLVNQLRKLDRDIYPLISMAGLPENILDTEFDFVPENAVINLLELIYDKAGQKKYGELIWYACRNVFIPRYISRIESGSTLREALNTFIEFMNTETTHTNVQLRHLVGRNWFIRDRRQKIEHSHHLAEQFALIFMVELIRGLTHSDWGPRDIVMRYSSSQSIKDALLLKHTQFFTERAVCAISLTDLELQQEVKLKVGWVQKKHQDPALAPSLFLHSFRDAITPYISMGRLPIAQAAIILNISVRTLQRRLAAENVSYSEVVDKIIQSQAMELMADFTIPVTRISSTLGYSDVAHFSRAFKRMTGHSPRAYRKMLIQ
ncbi:AraC family transcriptional regulator [Shewanella sp. UCD-KL12]|uniref:helix-turn-helix domain-containing protein n=1 Tax=Shewanella sp. UCD-KL12 TaxID=1917163 RepID=UPI000970E7CB|nr:AraC family transcriptional regulator [Shewanella sp. UCD-KL12]